MIHKTLKRFGMEGTVKDNADFIRLRDQFEPLVVEQMRAEGFIPVIGLGPFWSTSYDEKKETFSFIISMHGLHVGRKQACQVEGITAEGRVLKPSTPENKSSPSLTPSG